MEKTRKQKSPIVKIQELIWQECRRITKTRYGNSCYTCNKKNLSGSSWQTGHIIPKKICHHLKYDLRILRPQCYNCNINLGGNGAIGIYKMIQEHSIEFVDEIFEDLFYKKVKVDLEFYTKMLEELKKI